MAPPGTRTSGDRRRQRRLRRCRALRLVSALAMVAELTLLVATPVAAGLARPFGARFQVVDTGDVVLVGRPTVGCPAGATGAAGCLADDGGSGPAQPPSGRAHVDEDDDPSTFSSSRAELTLPSGAKVLWAGLYWGGTGDGEAGRQVRVARPTLGYQVVAATDLDVKAGAYQGFADVTSLVRSSGSGVYTVADVHSRVGAPAAHGGWALVVAVRNPAAPLRHLTVLDGFVALGPSGLPVVDTTVSGFSAKPTGPVLARVGVVAYGGSAATTGDSLAVGDQVLADGANPVDDLFNGTISGGGIADAATGLPAAGGPGVDIDELTVPEGAVANGATSSTLTLRSSADDLMVGVLTSVVDTTGPHLVVGNAAVDANGGGLEAGDVVEYVIEVVNRGSERADSAVLTDAVPEGATFVAGSLLVDAGMGVAAATEQVDGDPLEYDTTLERIVVNLGPDANGPAGGSLDPGGSSTVRFRLAVDDGGAANLVLTNQAQVAYRGAGGTALVALSDDPAGTGPTDASRLPANRAPLAGVDVVLTDGPSVAIDVLANDVDADGDRLSLVAVEPAVVGRVVCVPSGVCVYEAPPGFSGEVRFAYTAIDGAGLRSTAEVRVTVQPAAAPAPDPTAPTTPPDPGAPDATAEPGAPSSPDATADPGTPTGQGAPSGPGATSLPGATTGPGATAGPGATTGPGATVGPDAAAGPGATAGPGGTAPRATPGPPAVRSDDAGSGAGTSVASITARAGTPAATADAATTAAATAAGPPGGTATTTAAGAPGAAAGQSAAAAGRMAAADPSAVAGFGTLNLAQAAQTRAQTQAPRAVDDQGSTEAGRAVVLAVLANDIDLDGDLVPGSLSIVRPPARGTGLATAEGSIRYTPAAGLAGADELSYRVCDAGQRCAEATVRLAVTPTVLPVVPGQSTAPTSTPGPAAGSTTTSAAVPAPSSGALGGAPLAGTGMNARGPLTLALLLIAVGTALVGEAQGIGRAIAMIGGRRRQDRRPMRRPHRASRPGLVADGD